MDSAVSIAYTTAMKPIDTMFLPEAIGERWYIKKDSAARGWGSIGAYSPYTLNTGEVPAIFQVIVEPLDPEKYPFPVNNGFDWRYKILTLNQKQMIVSGTNNIESEGIKHNGILVAHFRRVSHFRRILSEKEL